jgi:hypothetical protein
MVTIYAARLWHEPLKMFGSRPIYSPVCNSEYDYWAGFSELWSGDDTIVNVEHDMETSGRLVDELVDCLYPLCTYAYQIHHRGPDFYAQGWQSIYRGPRARGEDIRWLQGASEHQCDLSGLGFCKITRDARKDATLSRCVWQGVEREVNMAVSKRWHVHWPEVEHFHR